MRSNPVAFAVVLCLSAFVAITAAGKDRFRIPRLEKRGGVTQLIIDGKPFLVLAGELRNSSSSSREYMEPIWPKLVRMHLNTVLAVVSWEQFEPAEGRFDFSLVDGLIRDARRHHLRLILLWFGSWKNGTSRYAADWVKTNQDRFPRVKNRDGNTLEILSPLGEETLKADARAFAALMHRVRETDFGTRTVILVQVQNEVGILGDSRDRSQSANLSFNNPVPKELMNHLMKRKDALLPEFRKVWESGGFKTSGTWEGIFGRGTATDEIFMAWNYARFIGRMAEAGKAEYPLPMFVNAWIVQPEDKGPGDYPSGGPVSHVHDVWRAGAPQIDILAPDIYLPDFPGILAQYSRSGNPVFIPESRGDVGGVANAFYAFGRSGAIGYSPFGIDNTARLAAFRPDPGQPEPENVENLPLPLGYAVLAQLSTLILEHQARGTIGAAWLNREKQNQTVTVGDYSLEFELRRNRRAPDRVTELGYGLAMALGSEEYLVAGSNVQVTFLSSAQEPLIAGLLSVEEGTYANGRWVPGRRLNGDEVQLHYRLSAASAANRSAAGLQFSPGAPTIQRAKLYRYR